MVHTSGRRFSCNISCYHFDVYSVEYKKRLNLNQGSFRDLVVGFSRPFGRLRLGVDSAFPIFSSFVVFIKFLSKPISLYRFARFSLTRINRKSLFCSSPFCVILKKKGDFCSTSDNMNTKTLVVYFSCTGTTEPLAEYAAESLGADLYEIIPEEPYTEEDLAYYTNGRADKEQNDPSVRPAISGSVENMEVYDTVILGYPIWLAYHNLIQCTQA